MSRWIFRDGNVLRLSIFGAIAVTELQNTTGVEHHSSDSHSLHMLNSTTIGHIKVDRKDAASGVHNHGLASLIPAGVSIFYDGSPFDATVIDLDSAALDEAAGRKFQLPECIIGVSDVISQLIRTIRAVTSDADMATDSLVVDGLNLALVSALAKYAPPQFGPVPNSGMSTIRFNRVREFVHQNINRTISLDELAGVAGMSRFHFCRAFGVVAGMSPTRYVLQKRVDMAKRKLLSAETPLAQLAFECGFSNQSHMTTVFGRITGMTPGEYRRSRN